MYTNKELVLDIIIVLASVAAGLYILTSDNIAPILSIVCFIAAMALAYSTFKQVRSRKINYKNERQKFGL